ncbi:MAG: hypothetical protein WC796_03505 [Candidatus Pacearchaeota archaeon]|jgi:hypothetical protein
MEPRLIEPTYETALRALGSFMPACYKLALEKVVSERIRSNRPLKEDIISTESFFERRNQLCDLAVQNATSPDEIKSIAVALKDYAPLFRKFTALATRARENKLRVNDETEFTALHCALTTYPAALEEMLQVVFEHQIYPREPLPQAA